MRVCQCPTATISLECSTVTLVVYCPIALISGSSSYIKVARVGTAVQWPEPVLLACSPALADYCRVSPACGESRLLARPSAAHRNHKSPDIQSRNKYLEVSFMETNIEEMERRHPTDADVAAPSVPALTQTGSLR